jgi:hypothetical protein
MLLRLHGFVIVARPQNGVALWKTPGGRILTQEQALEEVRREGGKVRE